MKNTYDEMLKGCAEVKAQLDERIDCLEGNLHHGSDGVWQREVAIINGLSYALETITGERYPRLHVVGDRKVEWR